MRGEEQEEERGKSKQQDCVWTRQKMDMIAAFYITCIHLEQFGRLKRPLLVVVQTGDVDPTRNVDAGGQLTDVLVENIPITHHG